MPDALTTPSPAHHSGADLAGCEELRAAHPARGHHGNSVVGPEGFAKATRAFVTDVRLEVEGRPIRVSEGVGG
jgi:hypothetical protein